MIDEKKVMEKARQLKEKISFFNELTRKKSEDEIQFFKEEIENESSADEAKIKRV